VPGGGAVLFGGAQANFQPLADTWIWSAGAWAVGSPAVSPVNRFDGAIGADPDRARTLLFGGDTPFAPGGRLEDAWAWTGGAWVEETAPVFGPSPRIGARMAYDAARKEFVLFGGNGYDDTWTYRTRAGDRPGAAFVFDFGSAEVATASVSTLLVESVAGGDAADPLSGQPVAGAELLLWDAWAGRWSALASGSAPSVLTASIAAPLAQHYVGGDGRIRVLVRPRGGNGPRDGVPLLSVDYVELTAWSGLPPGARP
jgi:hypothetical protein